jgi:hypothetical protein
VHGIRQWGTMVREWHPQREVPGRRARRKMLTPFRGWRGPLAPTGRLNFSIGAGWTTAASLQERHRSSSHRRPRQALGFLAAPTGFGRGLIRLESMPRAEITSAKLTFCSISMGSKNCAPEYLALFRIVQSFSPLTVSWVASCAYVLQADKAVRSFAHL